MSGGPRSYTDLKAGSFAAETAKYAKLGEVRKVVCETLQVHHYMVSESDSMLITLMMRQPSQ
jgi:hypothetical protein